MQLELSSDEARGLYDALQAYWQVLRREVARTEDHDFRHSLVQRLDVCERIAARLAEAGFGPQPGQPAAEE